MKNQDSRVRAINRAIESRIKRNWVSLTKKKIPEKSISALKRSSVEYVEKRMKRADVEFLFKEDSSEEEETRKGQIMAAAIVFVLCEMIEAGYGDCESVLFDMYMPFFYKTIKYFKEDKGEFLKHEQINELTGVVFQKLIQEIKKGNYNQLKAFTAWAKEVIEHELVDLHRKDNKKINQNTVSFDDESYHSEDEDGFSDARENKIYKEYAHEYPDMVSDIAKAQEDIDLFKRFMGANDVERFGDPITTFCYISKLIENLYPAQIIAEYKDYPAGQFCDIIVRRDLKETFSSFFLSGGAIL